MPGKPLRLSARNTTAVVNAAHDTVAAVARHKAALPRAATLPSWQINTP